LIWEPARASSTPNWSFNGKASIALHAQRTSTAVPKARHRSMDLFRAAQRID
jgi:hypothetical protein